MQWTRPLCGAAARSQNACKTHAIIAPQEASPRQKCHVVGIARAQQAFPPVGTDAHGTMLGRQRLYRAQVMACIAPLPPRRIALEACGGAHDWACHWRAHGHEVQLMAPPLVQPSVPATNNARRDAEALAEAVTRPTRRGGPTNDIAQHAIPALHRGPERLMGGSARPSSMPSTG